jgi:hypothetical protein
MWTRCRISSSSRNAVERGAVRTDSIFLPTADLTEHLSQIARHVFSYLHDPRGSRRGVAESLWRCRCPKLGGAG